MKPKSININGLRRASSLALVTTLTAFAAGFASATQYTWQGTTDTAWMTASNWNANGVAQTNGSFTHRLSVSNTGANISKPATYNFPGITTTYAADAASGSRGLVIGSGASGSMIISGGTFSTLGSIGADILGNGNGNTGTLTIDGTSNSGDAHYIGTIVNTDMGLGFGSFAALNIKNGSATVSELRTNNTTATINLETGGTLAMNKLTYLGGGNNIINFDGGTLKARTASTTFIATPPNGNSTINIKAGGAIIEADGSNNINITRPLLQDGISTGGGITKNGTATLRLGSISTTTGPAIVNAGGLVVPAGAASWQPSSFSHSGSFMGFSIGVYNPSNPAPINTGNVTFSSPVTVEVTGSQFVVGQVPLIAYSGTLTGFANLTLNPSSLPSGVVATLENDGAGIIFLDVTQGGFVWSGDSGTPGTGDWDTTSFNWNAFASAYSDPAPVTFPTIVGGGTVTLTTNVSPATAEFTNTTGNDYIIEGTGKITGASAVSKTGSGTVTLANTNDYSGNTTVTSGILSISSTAALPGWNVDGRYPISNGATLAVQNTVSDASIATILATTGNFAAGANIGFDLSSDRTYPGNITGPIGVTLVGFDSLTLAGSNDYTGTTRVPSGILKAGSSSTFTGTGPLQLTETGSLDLNGHNVSFTSINAGTLSNLISDESAGTGTSTLSLTSGGASFTGVIADGPTRKVAVRCAAANASNVPFNSANTYSGGLTLIGGIAPANGTRMLPSGSFTDFDPESGVITQGPYGTGTITIGEAAAERVQVYFNAANRTISNPIVVNSAAGTDTVGTFRVESIGNFLNGPITANLASAVFRNNVTGGSAGVGSITLTGPISTGAEPSSGLSVIAAGANGLTLTLGNSSAVPSSYTGNTVITGANATLTLAEPNQIPNGSDKGNVVMTGSDLDLAGHDETINGLSGSGTVDNLTATNPTNTLTLGDGDASGNTFSGNIANTGGELALVKVGSGTQTLSGFSTYSGPTNIRSGTLNINGSLDSATVTIGGATASGSPTLGGTDGTINGTVLVAAANGGAEGIINPGTAGTAASLNVAEATIAGTYACDVVSDSSDVIFVSGNLNISGAKFALNTATPSGGSYTVATYSGTLTGTFTPTPALPEGASLDYSTDGEIILTLPAPGGYDAWAINNNVTEGPSGDDDRDGISNLVEYALGLDPQTGDPAPGSFTGNTLSFTKGSEAKAAGDVSYIIETSTTLGAGSWSNAAATEDADTISYQLPANEPGGKLFARLKVIRP